MTYAMGSCGRSWVTQLHGGACMQRGYCSKAAPAVQTHRLASGQALASVCTVSIPSSAAVP